MTGVRTISAVVITALLISLFPASIFGESASPGEASSPDVGQQAASETAGTLEDEGSLDTSAGSGAFGDGLQGGVIAEFQPLPEETAFQKITKGSGSAPVLPDTLSVRTEGSDDFSDIPVQWTSDPPFDAEQPGVYLYTPELPDGYSFGEDLSPPAIQVEVAKAETVIQGLKTKQTPKSRTRLSNDLTVSPAYGRTVLLQLRSKGKWVEKKKYVLEDSERAALTLSFPNDWWTLPTSSWRLVISESDEAEEFISPVMTVSTKRYYQNPAGYIQIKNEIKLKDAPGYKLGLGHMGLRVRRVNSYFHIGDRYRPHYTAETKKKVAAFQRTHGLKATGVVNLATWKAMGFSEKAWYTLGVYVSPLKVNPSSTRKQHVEAMISAAKEYLGTDYVVGASGAPGQGVDCSGLIMQGLYAAGMDPYPISVLRHSKPGYEYESRNLWVSKKFKSVPYTKKKRGDLIFYRRGPKGPINHVAIYLGNGKVIESWPNKVVIWPIKNSHRSYVAGVRRAFVRE